jgi:hypothetical protein
VDLITRIAITIAAWVARVRSNAVSVVPEQFALLSAIDVLTDLADGLLPREEYRRHLARVDEARRAMVLSHGGPIADRWAAELALSEALHELGAFTQAYVDELTERAR